MRYIKSIVAVSLLLSIILCSTFSANATDEPADWNEIDWNTTNIMEFIDTDVIRIDPSLEKWLLDEAEFSVMFLATSRVGSAAAMEEICRIRYERFFADPYGLIQALALEDAAMQEDVMHDIVYGGSYYYSTFGQFLGSIRLPQSATPMEKAILAEIIRIARDNWCIEVPNTGDPVALSAAALLLSAAGIVCLTKRKKTA